MPWQEFTALWLLACAGSFTPGPNTTLSAALAANHGLRAALRFVCAVPLGWGLLLALCASGLGTAVAQWPALRQGLAWAGAAYLLWLAWRLACGPATLPTAPAWRVGFWQGVLLQFLNPKAWLLAMTVVAGWVAGRPDAGTRLAWVLPPLLALGFASNLAYALLGALLRGWLAQGRRLLWFNRAMAAVLVVTAWWMLRL